MTEMGYLPCTSTHRSRGAYHDEAIICFMIEGASDLEEGVGRHQRNNAGGPERTVDHKARQLIPKICAGSSNQQPWGLT